MARIPESFIADLIDATDLLAVVSRSLELKKSGDRQYVGLCPFHNEKSPSFSVDPSKRVYFCRGCAAAGNALTFMTQHQGFGFREAVEQLAKEASMAMPVSSAAANAAQREHAELYALLERAQKVFADELARSEEARAYLAERGVTDEMIGRFGLGFCPPSPKFLRQKLSDVSVGKLKKAGLVGESKDDEKKKEDFEWMRNRIIFPIRNASGKTVAFGGRTMGAADKRKKYLNTPETEVFRKGRELYGSFEAMADIRKSGVAIVVEGYLDVVVPSGAGVPNTVAPMGTALAKETIARLFKAAETVIFCFDSDDAGRRAAMRAMEHCAPLLDAHHAVKFALLPPNMDPDQYVLQHGADGYRGFLAEAMPLSKYLIAEYIARNDMTSAEGRARFAADAMNIVNQIVDPWLRSIMSEEVKNAAGIGVAVPGVNAPVGQIVPAAEPIRRRGFSNMAQRSSDAAEEPAAGQAPTPAAARARGAVRVSAPDEEEVMRPALQVMAIFVAEPAFAAYFEAEWLMLVNASEREIEAVADMIRVVRAYNEQHGGNEAAPISAAQFRPLIAGGPAGPYLARADSLAAMKNGTDLQKEFSETVESLSRKQARLRQIQVLARRRP